MQLLRLRSSQSETERRLCRRTCQGIFSYLPYISWGHSHDASRPYPPKREPTGRWVWPRSTLGCTGPYTRAYREKKLAMPVCLRPREASRAASLAAAL